jgi:bacillithiol system protein YtxJ
MFFQSQQGKPSIPEISSTHECDNLLNQDFTILFKHSPTCPISLFAHREVTRFREAQPDAPVFLISVRRQREIARHVAQKTGVQHETPQVLVLRRGAVVGSASHDAITAELLRSFFTASDA